MEFALIPELSLSMCTWVSWSELNRCFDCLRLLREVRFGILKLWLPLIKFGLSTSFSMGSSRIGKSQGRQVLEG